MKFFTGLVLGSILSISIHYVYARGLSFTVMCRQDKNNTYLTINNNFLKKTKLIKRELNFIISNKGCE